MLGHSPSPIRTDISGFKSPSELLGWRFKNGRNSQCLENILGRISQNHDPLLSVKRREKLMVENKATLLEHHHTELTEKLSKRKRKRRGRTPSKKRRVDNNDNESETPTLHPTTEKLLYQKRRNWALRKVFRTLSDPVKSYNLPLVLEKLQSRKELRCPYEKLLVEEFVNFKSRLNNEAAPSTSEDGYSPGKILDDVPQKKTVKPRFNLRDHMLKRTTNFRDYFLLKYRGRKKENQKQLMVSDRHWVHRLQHKFSRTFLISKYPNLSPHKLHKHRAIQRKFLRSKRKPTLGTYQRSLLTRLQRRNLGSLEHSGELVREVIHHSVRLGTELPLSVSAGDILAKAVQVFIRNELAIESADCENEHTNNDDEVLINSFASTSLG
eukprot:sb/3465672/